ncbi:MAG: DUF1353 domain-containing protein [Akkermansia sp.]|nr:DUF1353 domain-containing protein [Akkermansia sp.]MCD8070135.1 DUF1353 domain-containing protein [Akkermansiaceae bacterium]
MKASRAVAALWAIFIAGTGCCQVSPEAALEAEKAGWYQYMREKAPGACYRTLFTMHWRFPGLALGQWTACRTGSGEPVMKASGDSFTIYAGYVWDGATVGKTTPSLLMPTLVHDALYHARMHHAPVSRRSADRAFLALLRHCRNPHSTLDYRLVRGFGWLFDTPDDPPTLVIRTTGE